MCLHQEGFFWRAPYGKASKKPNSCGLVRKRGGGWNWTPCPQPKYFFLIKRKDAECIETEKCAQIFCEIFARVSVKNLGNLSRHFLETLRVFFLYYQSFFSFIKNIRFRPFGIFWTKKRFFFKSPQNTGFCRTGEGGSESCGLVCN